MIFWILIFCTCTFNYHWLFSFLLFFFTNHNDSPYPAHLLFFWGGGGKGVARAINGGKVNWDKICNIDKGKGSKLGPSLDREKSTTLVYRSVSRVNQLIKWHIYRWNGTEFIYTHMFMYAVNKVIRNLIFINIFNCTNLNRGT